MRFKMDETYHLQTQKLSCKILQESHNNEEMESQDKITPLQHWAGEYMDRKTHKHKRKTEGLSKTNLVP